MNTPKPGIRMSNFEEWMWKEKNLSLATVRKYSSRLSNLRRRGVDCEHEDIDTQLAAAIQGFWSMGRSVFRKDCRRTLALWHEYLAQQEAGA